MKKNHIVLFLEKDENRKLVRLLNNRYAILKDTHCILLSKSRKDSLVEWFTSK